MMTRTEHLLAIVAEECAEVAQRCTKALRFGLTEIQPGHPLNNAQRIAQEYGDLVAAMILLSRECADVMVIDATDLLEQKRQKIEHYLKYSAIMGCLERSGVEYDFTDRSTE
jgi:NTP pyrophosphatase (non-canonical NTP hydrolase)